MLPFIDVTKASTRSEHLLQIIHSQSLEFLSLSEATKVKANPTKHLRMCLPCYEDVFVFLMVLFFLLGSCSSSVPVFIFSKQNLF